MKPVTAILNNGNNFTTVYGLWQWDYGKVLRIQGAKLPTVVEVHFSLQEKGGDSITRVGTTKDGATDVVVPDSLLENNGTNRDYCIYAFIYLTDETSGQTVRKITLNVNTRPKPEAFEKPEDAEMFRKAIVEVNKSAEEAKANAILAESWSVGGTGTRENEDNDNAKYYANEAKDRLHEVGGQVKEAKKNIDAYTEEKKAELKGDTGNVFFAAFKVVNGRLLMYSDPKIDKVRFVRVGSRLHYRLAF